MCESGSLLSYSPGFTLQSSIINSNSLSRRSFCLMYTQSDTEGAAIPSIPNLRGKPCFILELRFTTAVALFRAACYLPEGHRKVAIIPFPSLRGGKPCTTGSYPQSAVRVRTSASVVAAAEIVIRRWQIPNFLRREPAGGNGNASARGRVSQSLLSRRT